MTGSGSSVHEIPSIPQGPMQQPSWQWFPAEQLASVLHVLPAHSAATACGLMQQFWTQKTPAPQSKSLWHADPLEHPLPVRKLVIIVGTLLAEQQPSIQILLPGQTSASEAPPVQFWHVSPRNVSQMFASTPQAMAPATAPTMAPASAPATAPEGPLSARPTAPPTTAPTIAPVMAPPIALRNPVGIAPES